MGKARGASPTLVMHHVRGTGRESSCYKQQRPGKQNSGARAILIEKTDAIASLKRNLHRTEMLIEAMAKIKAYNRLYQMEDIHDREYYEMVKAVQDQQLEHIERSCGQHAIISLATAFETYYIQPPFNEHEISTEAKRLRTKFQRILFNSYDQIKSMLTQE